MVRHAEMNAALGNTLAGVPVVPVVTIRDAARAVPLAEALAAGGLRVIEVTLRTDAALVAIRAIASARPDVLVGAGTVLDPVQGAAAIQAGAKFLVSPGITPALASAAAQFAVPYLPGVATASEAMALADLGFSFLKFFPAEPAGGVAYLKALADPLAGLRFCPTGGITADGAAAYRALPTVVTVGGSWVAPAATIEAGDFAKITGLARAETVAG
jgi:2-dehydro-3-deoxyphosphogluconate aldolase/(4S)-4-hydroxy-2-oxoglutarate aldolase